VYLPNPVWVLRRYMCIVSQTRTTFQFRFAVVLSFAHPIEFTKFVPSVTGMLTATSGLHETPDSIEALCYKQEGRGVDSQWCHWSFSLVSS
jgi:hypothetical protein